MNRIAAPAGTVLSTAYLFGKGFLVLDRHKPLWLYAGAISGWGRCSILRIEFANSLRGMAALIVMGGHYVFGFQALGGAYKFFPKLGQNPFTPATLLAQQFPLNLVIFPAFGVALFFLISGLVIPQSVNAFGERGRGGFVVARIFRIWPTYWAGLAVSIFAIWLAAYINGHAMPHTWQEIAANASLFRDWIGARQIDGVVWTLEVEAKFYLFILLFWTAIRKARLYPLVLIAAVALLAMPYGLDRYATFGPISAAATLWPLPFLVFMAIGIAFNFHIRGRIGTPTLLALSLMLFGVFCITITWQGHSWRYCTSYGFALVVFSALYFFARDWSGGPIFRFFADISFPLYASHAAFGYTGMSIMAGPLGWPPIIALAVQIPITLLLAWMLHVAVERPTHRLGKALGRSVMPIRQNASLPA